MLAKLCSWAPSRGEAIDAMATALDRFVVDGIAHNIPFLAALMQHPRWREGRLSTAFIDEEFPDGFVPRSPDTDELAVLSAVASAVELTRRARLDHLPGRLAPHSGALKRDWAVRIGEGTHAVQIVEGIVQPALSLAVTVDGGPPFEVASAWRPGEPVWEGKVGRRPVSVQVRPTTGGFKLDWQGLSVLARPMLPRIAALERLMPVKVPPDTSKLLLCPMPGLVVSVAVREGQEIKAGETLAVVEAMKMENVLRAERDVTVASINVKPGDTLAVDAVIMQFA